MMWNREFWLQLITAIVATVAFSVMFRVRVKHLLLAALGGGLTFFVYAIVYNGMSSVFAAALLASAASAVYSELCARIQRAPALVFILPCAIPIVPGGSLYQAMLYLISKNFSLAKAYLIETLTIAMGIAGGLAAVSLLFHLVGFAVVRLSEGRTKK